MRSTLRCGRLPRSYLGHHFEQVTTLTKSFQSAHPLLLGVVTSAVATGANYAVPEQHSGEVVGLVFLVAAVLLALPRDSRVPASHYGLSLGGILDPEPLSLPRISREAIRAALVATLVALVVLPPFWLGYVFWFSPQGSFDWQRALENAVQGGGIVGWLNLILVHLLVVALPEEAFFRGYLQTALIDRLGKVQPRLRRVGFAIVLSSVLFALGHLATTPVIGRLAVFFPSLLFGLLRDKTGSVGASIVLHAQCNVFSALLNSGYTFR